jgi:hypothetical protein
MHVLPHPPASSPADLLAMLDTALAAQALEFHAAITHSLRRAQQPEVSDAMAVRLRSNAAALFRAQRQMIMFLLQQHQATPERQEPMQQSAPVPGLDPRIRPRGWPGGKADWRYDTDQCHRSDCHHGAARPHAAAGCRAHSACAGTQSRSAEARPHEP